MHSPSTKVKYSPFDAHCLIFNLRIDSGTAACVFRHPGAVDMGHFSGRIAVILPFAGLIAACATPAPPQSPMVARSMPAPASGPALAQQPVPPPPMPHPAYKVGDPYQIDGIWYYPKEQP